MNFKLSLDRYILAILVLLGGYVAIAVYLGVFLHFNFLISDALGYWKDSLAWQTPFQPFHVPGYPLMIAMLRGITFGIPSAIGLMMIINLATFLGSAFLVYRIIKLNGVGDELAALGILLFGLWPFVGLTYTAYPLADIPAIFFFLLGMYFLLGSRRLPAALFLGLSMMTHKAMWLFVGLLIIAEFLYRREFVSKRNVLFFIIMCLPVGFLWLSGSFYHSSITWLFSSNLGVEVASRSRLPVLDGLLGTFMEGAIKGMVKGILLVGFACFAAATIYASFKFKYERFQYGLALSLSVLILFLILNHNEIWAAMRFGRLLAIPLMLLANTNLKLRKIVWWKSPAIVAALSILFLSQFAYAWYMAVVYFGQS